MANMPSSLSCLEKAASMGSCDSSSNLWWVYDTDNHSLSVSENPLHAHDEEGDLGKVLSQRGDTAVPLNPSRWKMLANKDHNPSICSSLTLSRYPTSAVQRNVTVHNRWNSEAGEHEEMKTAMQWSAASECMEPSKCKRLSSPGRQSSDYRANRTTPNSAASIASLDATNISVPSVIAVRTWHSHCHTSSFVTDAEKHIRQRSFDENPTLPQRQQSNHSLRATDDFSSSSSASFES